MIGQNRVFDRTVIAGGVHGRLPGKQLSSPIWAPVGMGANRRFFWFAGPAKPAGV